MVETKPVRQQHVIDLDAAPFIPEGCRVVRQLGAQGVLEWDPALIGAYTSLRQRDGEVYIDCFYPEMVGKTLLGAQVADYLVDHPNLIPEDFPEELYFLGTQIRDKEEQVFVWYLWKDGGVWRRARCPLLRGWTSDGAVLYAIE